MTPFLKWVGGKRQLLPKLLEHAPSTFNRYFEPFVGGGALFFALSDRPGTFLATLSDTNSRLIRAYRGVRDDVDGVIERLERYEHTEQAFYEARATPPDGPDSAVAAWLIYMNKTCYNGLYRVNKKGQFNVPFGRYTNPNICDEKILRECSQQLQDVVLDEGDFERSVYPACEGDFVYFDPPYIPVSVTSFTSYTKDAFTMADHQRLAACAKKLKRRGVKVFLSNSSAPVVRALYEGFDIIEVNARRSVNSKAAGRGSVKEVIIK
jgi:DNA adenine methylase